MFAHATRLTLRFKKSGDQVNREMLCITSETVHVRVFRTIYGFFYPCLLKNQCRSHMLIDITTLFYLFS